MLDIFPKTYKIASVTFLFVAFFGCIKADHWSDHKIINQGSWSMQDTLQFHANISDTSAYYNLWVTIRNGGEYAYSNLFVFVEAKAPAGEVLNEKVEVVLANKSGKWLGDGFGSKYYLKHPYKKQVRFATPGIYSFKLVQGMREELLNGIFDVGLAIEKVE